MIVPFAVLLSLLSSRLTTFPFIGWIVFRPDPCSSSDCVVTLASWLRANCPESFLATLMGSIIRAIFIGATHHPAPSLFANVLE